MKKLILILTAVIAMCSTVVMAQKVDAEGFKAKFAKADADSQHAKKGLKAATWINRGDVYFSSVTEPTKALFVGAERAMLELSCGKGKAGQKEINGKTYTTLSYPYFTVYLLDNKIVAWTVSKMIDPNATKIALDSYAKAFEIDPEAKSKIKSSLVVMENYYKQLGAVAISLNDTKRGSAAYLNVCKIQSSPAFGGVDPMVQFYAGYMLTLEGEKNPSAYVNGEKLLKAAVDNGYPAVEDANTEVADAERGNIYYYLYHCAYAQREKNPAKIAAAKKYLQEGISKYPKNERIFEGLLQIYTNEEGMGDPKELLSTIESTIANNPKSINAWFARGRVYYALEEYDECIASFQKVVEIEPTSFDGNYYLGLFYMLKGDAELEKMKEISYSDQSKYDADLARLNQIYGEAIAPFEAAHAIKPTDESTLAYLKQLCFRMRDEPGIMEKYNKYNELYKNL